MTKLLLYINESFATQKALALSSCHVHLSERFAGEFFPRKQREILARARNETRRNQTFW